MLAKENLRIDIYKNASRKVWMQITHIPTGLSVAGSTERSEYKLKEDLIDELEEMVREQNRV